MAKQKIEIEVDIPEGWKVVDYRRPKPGESYLDCGEVRKETISGDRHAYYPHLILIQEPLAIQACRKLVEYRRSRSASPGVWSEAFMECVYASEQAIADFEKEANQ